MSKNTSVLWEAIMARYTQQLLSSAIKELIKEKPLDEITVQELVDRANVNRKTFYYNFHSISDLLNWMYTEGFRAEVSAAQIAPDTWKQLFLDTMDYVRGEAVSAGHLRFQLRPQLPAVHEKALRAGHGALCALRH
jgi:AcrR family transcriptional regulator